ncbi:MAG: SGNH/GDSL hydrolase family protein [Lentisphaerae bacterium]|nr:SGNH/GDSL hydrolase family protein [Lentisphaerota bacterium]
MVAAAVGVVWTAGEIYYRGFVDSTDSFGLTLVCHRWFERHFHMNRQGLRDDRDYLLERTPGRTRISFLGDSFTAGHGIANPEDRFANRIRRALAADCEVHVLAQNGVNSVQEVQGFAGLVGSGYKTDVLVLVYVLNDIGDLMPEWNAILDRIYSERMGEEPFLVRHSYFINMQYYRWKMMRDPDIRDYFSCVRNAYGEEAWQRQQQVLGALFDLCKEQHIKLLVVTFPFLHALGADYAYADVHRRLNAYWTALGVPHLDLLETYRAYPPATLVVGRCDAHPNRFAHELAAAAIGKFLLANVPPRQPPPPMDQTDQDRPAVRQTRSGAPDTALSPDRH